MITDHHVDCPYENDLQQIELVNSKGLLGCKIVDSKFVEKPWLEKTGSYARAFFDAISGNFNNEIKNSLDLLQKKVTRINTVHEAMKASSSHLKIYFKTAELIKSWNDKFYGTGSKLNMWILQSTCLQHYPQQMYLLGLKFSDRITFKVAELPEELFACSIANDTKLPLIITLKNPQNYSRDSLFQMLEIYQKNFLSLIEKHGALLFRNFPINNVDDFVDIQKAVLNKVPNDYRGREGSRDKVGKEIYTSTKAPEWCHIPLHHELSCTTSPLSFLNFFCDVAPPPGTGQTILGSTKEITKALKALPEVWELFENRDIHYISRHPPKGNYFNKVNPSQKTREDSFETSDKAEMERICQEKGFAYRWLGEWIEVTRTAPGTKMNPATGEQVWYNQAYLYHLNPRMVGGWLNYFLANLLYWNEETRQYKIEFADGTPIPQEIVYKIYDVLQEHTLKVDWEKGNVLFINNGPNGAMHGKAPYPNGAPRLILTGMIA